jgi:hypothetical protein
VQCSVAQYGVQCSAVQCSAMQCSAVQCSAVQCSAVQCSEVQCSAVQCSAVQCSALQYSAVQCSPHRSLSYYFIYPILPSAQHCLCTDGLHQVFNIKYLTSSILHQVFYIEYFTRLIRCKLSLVRNVGPVNGDSWCWCRVYRIT